jgi:hypothetical protein
MSRPLRCVLSRVREAPGTRHPAITTPLVYATTTRQHQPRQARRGPRVTPHGGAQPPQGCRHTQVRGTNTSKFLSPARSNRGRRRPRRLGTRALQVVCSCIVGAGRSTTRRLRVRRPIGPEERTAVLDVNGMCPYSRRLAPDHFGGRRDDAIPRPFVVAARVSPNWLKYKSRSARVAVSCGLVVLP